MTMRRSVSQKLMSAPAVAPGERLWVPRDGAWVRGEVLAQANTLVTLELEDGAEHELDLGFGELHRANGPGGGVGGSYDDATAMRHLNEPELLHARARYLAGGLHASARRRRRRRERRGKTETSKIVLAYLAWRGGGGDAGASLSEALDAVALALEAGDAPGESNYHALYTLRRLKGVTPLGECRVLPGGFAYSDKAPRDKAVNAALELLIQGDALCRIQPLVWGVLTKLQNSLARSHRRDASAVWRVCAAVVHLGDVLVFGEDRGQIDQHPGCPFELFARNLGFDAHFGDEVARSLAETVVRTRGESFCRALTPAQTQLAVQALARHLYGRLFDALVAACDERLRRDAAWGNPVGVLDAFGFEAFEVNGFETLLINYANEALQQHFCDAVFAAELRLFEAEGHPGAARTHPKDCRRRFTVRHYAAHVAYDVCGGPGAWTKGNVDGVDADFLDLAKEGAQLPFAKALLLPPPKTSRKKPTVASTFVRSMQALHATLKACDCGFIRCVKPAPSMRPATSTPRPRVGSSARWACSRPASAS
ncbi:hypothetical protein JL721_11192 [Aureococcus anophagefferens]|nr:hypothetical protein JL721_11192 [Aureococcus anophagefferens]